MFLHCGLKTKAMTERERQIWNAAVDACIKKAGVIPVKRMENFDEVTDYVVNVEQLEKLKK